VSLDVQRKAIADWAAAHRLELVDTFADEGVSGTKTNRAGLLAAIDAAKTRRAVLVVYSVDRLGRTAQDNLNRMAELAAAGVPLSAIQEGIDTSTVVGEFVAKLLSVVADLFVKQTRAKIRASLALKRTRCEKLGGRVPLGFDVAPSNGDGVPVLVPNAQELEAVARMVARRNAGIGYRALARELNEAGIPTKNRARWAAKTVRAVLIRVANDDRTRAALAAHTATKRPSGKAHKRQSAQHKGV
jgi:site-specific DNA recombinase